MALGQTVGGVSVQVAPDTNDFKQKLRVELERINAALTVGLRIDSTGIRQQLRAINQSLSGAQVAVRIVFEPIGAVLRAQLQREVDAAARGVRATVDIDVRGNSLERAMRSLTGSSGGGGPGQIVSAVAKSFKLLTASMLGLAAAGSAVNVVGGLAATLAQLAPIALLLPAALLGVAGAVAAVKLGLSGFSDALSSGDFSKLSPSAKAAAVSIRSFRDELDKVKSATQENLFAGLAGPLTELGDKTFPTLQAKLPMIATGFRDMAREAITAFSSIRSQDAIGQILDNTASGVKALAPALANIGSAFLMLGENGSNYFERAGSGITGLTEKFRAFAERITTDGSFERFVDAAIAGFKDLGAIVGNIGSIIGSVFSGLSAGSGATSFLASIRDITAALKTFAASNEAQTFLQQLGATMAVAGTAVKDLLLAALQSLMPVVSAVLPLFNALGLAISQIAQSGALQALGKAVGEVVQALVNGLVPIVPLVAGLFTQLVQAVTPVVSALAPVVSQLLAGLLPAFQQLLPVLGQAAITIGTALATAITQLTSSGALQSLATSIADIVIAVLPLIPQLTNLAVSVLPLVVDAFKVAADIVRDVVVPAIREIVPIVQFVITAIQANVEQWKTSWQNMRDAVDQAVEFIRGAVTFFQELPGKFREWLGQAATAVSEKLAEITTFFRNLPGQITGAIGNLGSLLVNAGKSLMDGLLSGIRDGLQAVLDFAGTVAGKIAAVKGPIPKDRKELIPAGIALMAGLDKGLRKGFRPVLRTAGLMASQLADSFAWNERTFPNLGETSVSGSVVSTQFASIDHAVRDNRFGSIEDKMAGAIERGLSGWELRMNRDGVTRLVNKTNNERKRR